MDQTQFDQQVHLVSVVAAEATEEPDAVARHPEVIDALNALAGYDGLNDHFGGNGHNPNGFAAALAKGLAPYRDAPLDDNPDLIQGITFLAWVLQGDRSPEELAEMQMLA
jgi:hypothetical protein